MTQDFVEFRLFPITIQVAAFCFPRIPRRRLLPNFKLSKLTFGSGSKRFWLLAISSLQLSVERLIHGHWWFVLIA